MTNTPIDWRQEVVKLVEQRDRYRKALEEIANLAAVYDEQEMHYEGFFKMDEVACDVLNQLGDSDGGE